MRTAAWERVKWIQRDNLDIIAPLELAASDSVPRPDFVASLGEHFSKYGEIEDTVIMKDR